MKENKNTFNINFKSASQKEMWKKKNPKVLRHIVSEREAEVSLDEKALDMVLGVDEGANKFLKTAASAHEKGKDEFEFEGETYPVKISAKVADRINNAKTEGTLGIPFPTNEYHKKSNAQLKAISENSFKQSVRVRFADRELGQKLLSESNVAETILNWRLYGKGTQGMPVISEKKSPKEEGAGHLMGAAAAAHEAGKDEFEFNGKTYPVKISDKVADKINNEMDDESEEEDNKVTKAMEEGIVERRERPDEKTIDILKKIAKTGASNMWNLVEPYWIGRMPTSDDHNQKSNMSTAKKILKKYGIKESTEIQEEKLNPQNYVYTSEPKNDLMGVVTKVSGAKPYHAAIVDEKNVVQKDVGKYTTLESARKILTQKKLYEDSSYNPMTKKDELEPRSAGEKRFKDQHYIRVFNAYSGKYEDEETDETEDFVNEEVDDIDNSKLKALVRSGLVDSSKLSIVRRVVKKLQSGEKISNPEEKSVIGEIITKLLSVVTSDSSIFMKAKKMVKQEEVGSANVDDIDDMKLKILIRSGLIDDKKLPIVKRIVKKLKSDDKITLPAEREVLIKLVRTLLSIVTSDVTIYQKTKKIVKENINEKSVSQQQQKLMGLAYSYKKGDVPESEVSDEVKKIANTMSMKDLKDFASTKHTGLPKKIVEESYLDDEIDEEDVHENEMVLRKLFFIQYAAEEMIDYLNRGFETEEWFQNKIAAIHEKIKGLHAYIEGDKRLHDMVNGMGE